MGDCAHHIEKREDAIEGVPDDDDALVGKEGDSADTLRVVSLDHPDSVVETAFTRETHRLELHVEGTL